MKVFAFIFSIYILALSVVPCSDGMLHSSMDADIEITASESNHNHSEHSDHCTPFCVCACCGSMIALPSVVSTLFSKIDISTEYRFHYKFDYSFDYNEGVWHPPAYG